MRRRTATTLLAAFGLAGLLLVGPGAGREAHALVPDWWAAYARFLEQVIARAAGVLTSTIVEALQLGRTLPGQRGVTDTLARGRETVAAVFGSAPAATPTPGADGGRAALAAAATASYDAGLQAAQGLADPGPADAPGRALQARVQDALPDPAAAAADPLRRLHAAALAAEDTPAPSVVAALGSLADQQDAELAALGAGLARQAELIRQLAAEEAARNADAAGAARGRAAAAEGLEALLQGPERRPLW